MLLLLFGVDVDVDLDIRRMRAADSGAGTSVAMDWLGCRRGRERVGFFPRPSRSTGSSVRSSSGSRWRGQGNFPLRDCVYLGPKGVRVQTTPARLGPPVPRSTLSAPALDWGRDGIPLSPGYRDLDPASDMVDAVFPWPPLFRGFLTGHTSVFAFETDELHPAREEVLVGLLFSAANATGSVSRHG